MSKKKSEKAAKEKKQSAKKALVSAKAFAVVPEEAGMVESKEPKLKSRKSKPALRAKAAKAGEISNEEIALRAYFIAERRQKMGWHGDSTGDWVEAERQLKAEAVRKK
jgi:hypothetical protein